ncbi:MAG: fabZ [Rickettsiales bacterium]|jgi:3-hydroxyacyl-[acyl-carrier-protein] dehydratase|nr:fabZ [Rickettsiales bacterium]
MTAASNLVLPVDVTRILQMIPHRYPIMLVDRIIALDPGKSVIGIKNVTFNEPHFMGHFPGKPIMPGVLIIEAMAQTAAVLVVDALGTETEGKLVYFMSIEGAKFRKPVTPGDTLRLTLTAIQSRRSTWKFSGVAEVDGVKVAEATITAMIADGPA